MILLEEIMEKLSDIERKHDQYLNLYNQLHSKIKEKDNKSSIISRKSDCD